MESVQHLRDYQVVEFRRYVTTDGKRANFVKYFDAYFPEAFEQLGAMVFGQFTERGNPNRFTWLRGFRDINARPIINAAFYYGPLWKEHRVKVNAILPDSDNVMLLRPLHPEQGITVLPAVDPVIEGHGAQGVVVAQIFAVKKGSEDAFAKLAVAAFAHYRIEGVHPAGVLVTLDVPNNFPQLPIRPDGPFLVWLGVARDNAVVGTELAPRLTAAEQSLFATGLLRDMPERIVMDPTPRSRLRWLSDLGTSP
ncbi:NIPSNAP family protein [Rhodanobacter ginsengiterrae]|uniref:NIPSNAP family protein n=1 Tax=Rhodanobacter ginsengiterrae TaxID=2008451 RepID=UPI003CEF1F20